MRSEKEMFDLLISTAREDENILAAYLEGSRTVPGVPKDIFQDYDLVYVVKETRPLSKIGNGSTDSGNGSICSIRRKGSGIMETMKTAMAG